MKIPSVLYLIFSALILSYPLYEEVIFKEEIREDMLLFVYSPFALICFGLMFYEALSTNKIFKKFNILHGNHTKITDSLISQNLSISKIKIHTKYIFRYKQELTAKIVMQKNNPIRAYFIDTEDKKNHLEFLCDNPQIYYPDKNAIEFSFSFRPSHPSKVYGKQVADLERFDQIYFPWQSFIHFLALLKVGGEVQKDSEPTLNFQIVINDVVYIDHESLIENIPDDSQVIIFNTEPSIFSNIDENYLSETNLTRA